MKYKKHKKSNGKSQDRNDIVSVSSAKFMDQNDMNPEKVAGLGGINILRAALTGSSEVNKFKGFF